ncbi:MAG: serine/threonine protein kinase [Planctomycetota bacterium]
MPTDRPTDRPDEPIPGETAELPTTPPGGDVAGTGRPESSKPASARPPSGRPPSAQSGSSVRILGEDRDSVAPAAAGLRFVRELGRGGLGSVWLAVQETEEFHRQVAVKLVRRGMDTEDILARFALERQLLAGLEHPNIVRLYGAGTVVDGRPYFVMEYVEGLPIDRFCDERRLPIEERLRLFVQVCRAVHHAHSRLVVHRDLKPSNIIVTTDGTVKLLDFGIAKLVDASLAPVVVDPTAPELRVLTPEYASPEQIRGQMIGTPSDVYSLGVILYELLTGQRPYRIKTRIMRELERIVCEEEPAQPSTVVSRPSEAVHVETGADGATRVVQRQVKPETVSKARGVAVERLSRRLRGDLDVIVLHALEKSPTSRYASAEAMAADVERHLRSEPIEARKTSAAGRAVRFVRRNRVAVGVTVLAVAGALGGLGSLYFAERARGESDRAAAAEALKDRERALAELRLAQVRELSDTMLTNFYEKLRPMQGGAELRGLLADAVSRQIEALEKQDSIAGARVADPDFDRLLALGYRGLGRVRGDSRGEGAGDYAQAREAFEKSAEILARLKATAAAEQVPGLNIDIARTAIFWSDTARVAGDLAAARAKLMDAEAMLAARGLGASKEERLLHAVVLG